MLVRAPARALEHLDLPGSRVESSDQAGRFSLKDLALGSPTLTHDAETDSPEEEEEEEEEEERSHIA
ncbi:hypothetical protein B0A55_05628 [Friedmanniomyces simplex]|uniref:Uncharacterized protein n=1 Tax=Friedmanniomyces simplex TaxID=329884 RepID=A0A4U0XEG6_9PEZI|nr:hypothetical protein B0A55_05628 [Friedmanniomyces simplex]